MGRGSGSDISQQTPDISRAQTPVLFTSHSDLHTLADALNDSAHPRRAEAWSALDRSLERAGWDPEGEYPATRNEILGEIFEGSKPPLTMNSQERALIRDVIDESEDFRRQLAGMKTKETLRDGTPLFQREAKELRLLFSDVEVSTEDAEANQAVVDAKLIDAPARVREAANALAGTRSLTMRSESDEGFGFYDANGDRRALIDIRPGHQQVTYFNVLGRPDRPDGPALVAEDRVFYLRNGRFHRADGPAQIVFTKDGRQIEEHYVNGVRYEDMAEWKAAATHNPDGENLITFAFSFAPA